MKSARFWRAMVCLAALAAASAASAGVARKIVLLPGLGARGAGDLHRSVPELLVDRVEEDGGVVCYATGDELKQLEGLGVEYRVLFEDERDRARQAALDTGRPWPETTYAEMIALLQNLAAAYPGIARYHVYGTSINGRSLAALEITDEPDIDDPLEAEVRMQGNIHGDEYMSLELMCLLAQYLCQNYGSLPQVTALVDSHEIWVIPSINPDGHAAGTRGNANGVDMNRNHGYMWATGGGSSAFSEQELRYWYTNAIERNYSLSLSFHGETTYFNYPWNLTGYDAPDKAHFHSLGVSYTALGNDYTVVEGWDWYQTNGDTNDWSYGARGDFDVTIETPGYSSTAIQTDWNENREAMLYYIGQAGYGVRGVVTDGSTGAPLSALVRVIEKARWPSYTDPVAGDYHRPLTTGTYSLLVWANGYAQQTVTGVAVTTGQTTMRDVALSRNYSTHAFQIAWNEITSYYESNSSSSEWQWTSWLQNALGPPDGFPGSLGTGCELVLDMGAGYAIEDGTGIDFTVHEADVGDGNESCQVHAANSPFGPWTLVGTATGTTEFDLAGHGLSEARYLRFVDDGNGSSGGQYPGYDLDAVTGVAAVPGCGLLALDRSLAACDDALAIDLVDEDLNVSPGVPDTAEVTATSDSQPGGLIVALAETGPDTGEFSGLLQLAASGGPDLLLVADGDQITVTYQDADCQGQPLAVNALAEADCAGPAIGGVSVNQITDSTAVVSWTTDEPADSTVIFGLTVPDTTVHLAGLATSHSVELTGLAQCTSYVFEVASSDAAGNQTWDDAGGAYYEFSSTGREFVLNADMSINPGWTVSGGQWAWGVPAGASGDPSSGHTGSQVYGYNLSGAYANNIPAYYLTTPALDCSAGTGVTLSFRRWLGVESSAYDDAVLQVSGNGGSSWTQVWANPASSFTDTEWTDCEYDISAVADGHSDVRVRWTMGPTDSSVTYCGWNLDDVQVFYWTDCNGSPTPTRTPSPSPTATPPPTATRTPTPTSTPTSVPTATPTPTTPPTDTPEPTATLEPSATPEETATPEPTATATGSQPTATPEPTAPPAEVGVDLVMNADLFHAGEPFHLGVSFWNGTGETRSLPMFIILDVLGGYWFWPGWTEAPDCVTRNMPAGVSVTDEPVLDFTWPAGAGRLDGVRFWAAFTAADLATIEGSYDVETWGFE